MQKLPSLKLNLRLDFATQFSQIVILRSTTSLSTCETFTIVIMTDIQTSKVASAASLYHKNLNTLSLPSELTFLYVGNIKRRYQYPA